MKFISQSIRHYKDLILYFHKNAAIQEGGRSNFLNLTREQKKTLSRLQITLHWAEPAPVCGCIKLEGQPLGTLPRNFVFVTHL